MKTWAVVLAGGEGLRLRPLVRRAFGEERPKQFCRLLGPRSLLRQTLDRVRLRVPPERTVVVGVERHARYLAAELGPRPGPTLLQQPWLIVALTIYALNLGLAFFIQRPNLRRLIGVKAGPDDQTWRERAKRQRYVSYLMAGLVGVIGFLMSTKPTL